jgi:hypothetical protein
MSDNEPELRPHLNPMKVKPERLHFEELIERHISSTVLGEPMEYTWALITRMVQREDGQIGIEPGYMLVISCRSPILRPPRVSITDVVWDAYPVDATVTQLIDKMIGQLFDLRRKLCSTATN